MQLCKITTKCINMKLRNPFSPWQPAIIGQVVLIMALRGIFLVRGTLLSCCGHRSLASGRLALLTDAVESSERIIARRLDPESASKKLDKKRGKGTD